MNHQAEVEQAAIGAQVHGFDVCAYGAKGDGTADDTAAIQAAIDDAERHGGGIVRLPAGQVFKTSYTLFYGSNVHVSGYGAEIRFEPQQRDATAFVPRSYLGTAETRNATFTGFKLTTLADKGNGIGTPKAEKVTIQDVWTDQIFWHLCDIAGGKDIVIRHCRAENHRSAAFQVDNLSAIGGLWALTSDGKMIGAVVDGTFSENVSIVQCTAQNGAYGVHLHREGSKHILIEGCTLINNRRGIWSDPSRNYYDVKIVHNTLSGCEEGGVLLFGQHHGLIIEGNHVDGDLGSPDSCAEHGLFLNQSRSANTIGSGTRNHMIQGNIIENCRNGIGIEYSNGAIIANNIVASPPNPPSSTSIYVHKCDQVSVSGNLIQVAQADGILLAENGSHLHIANNMR